MAFEHRSESVLGILSQAPRDFEAWEKLAKPPEIYDPPQRAQTCCTRCVYQSLRSTACCIAPIARVCSAPCCQIKMEKISDSDEWLVRMLQTGTHPNFPEALKGVWWLQDNVAAEGVMTFHDAEWTTASVGMKSSKYNWTVDACNLWGVVLTGNFWIRGGRHLFEFSPNRKWISISVSNPGGSHWIYVIQPGDVFKTPDGEVMDLTPGEDMMRVSYATLDTKSEVGFKYLMRRIAYLDADGKLVKTPNFEKLLKVATSNPQHCCGSCGCLDCGDHALHNIENTGLEVEQ
ncbi:Stra6 [Symbiodinium natans]|uniref:Stra6 protein n=1 Tax=Symbiodinium natans TaxID=878477 RepID=A0A812I4A1_9DINO|nr:Stra6 [Symbiodinium natans]